VKAYCGQLRNYNHHCCHEVDYEVDNVVAGIVGTDQEETDGHAEEVFFGWRVLVAIVNLLPHVQVVVGACIEVEGDTAHPVEHEIGAAHVRDVGHSPGEFLGDARPDVVEDLEADDEDGMDEPCACKRGLSVMERGCSMSGNVPLAFTHSAFRFGNAA
jgi:hypothetical protein